MFMPLVRGAVNIFNDRVSSMNQRSATVDVIQNPTHAVLTRTLVLSRDISFLKAAGLILGLSAVVLGAVALIKASLLQMLVVTLLAVTALAALLGAHLTVRTQGWHGRFTMDADLGGVQKSHTVPVPRIGGVSILLGLLTLVAACISVESLSATVAKAGYVMAGLLACGSVAFLSGVTEDVTKRVSVGARLGATVLSGLLAAVLMDAYTMRLDVPFLDDLMVYPVVAMVVSAVAVGGIANAINIVDGFNGLAGGALVVIGLGFALLAGSVNDPLLVMMSLGLVAVSLGFLGVNYPAGKLFLGDGGAYLLGFWLGEIAVLTLARHPEVSCWTVLALLAYPVVEVLVSVVRRKLAKASPGAPDRGHLHQQIQQAIKHVLFARAGQVLPVVNPQVSPFAWLLNGACVVLALQAADSFAAGVVAFFVAGLLYLAVYAVVKRFNVMVAAAQPATVTSGVLEVKVDGQAQTATVGPVGSVSSRLPETLEKAA